MRRRRFLELLAAGSVAGNAGLAAEIVPFQPQRLMLTIAGINATTAPAPLGALLAALVAASTPVNLIVETQEGPNRLRAESEIGRLVRRYIESFPGLVEVVVWCPDLGRLAPYQAARAAQGARMAFHDALYATGQGQASTIPSLVSIACMAPLDSNAASATLASGFRNVLELPEGRGQVSARLDRLGLLSILGGERLRVAEAADALLRGNIGLQRHLVFSAAEISVVPVEALLDSALAIGRVLRGAALDLSMVAVLASDIQMRTDTAFRRRLGIHLLEPDTGATVAGFDAFKAMLSARRIPFSTGPDASRGEGGELSYWIPLTLAGKGAPDPDRPFGSFEGQQIRLARRGTLGEGESRFGVIARPVLDSSVAGLTGEAELNIPVHAFVDMPDPAIVLDALRFDAASDGLLLVSARALQDPIPRGVLMQEIRRIDDAAETRFLTLPALCAEMLPKDPLLPTLLLTRTRALKEPAILRQGADRHAGLMEDARAAWAYFEKNTVSATGLCPTTVVTRGRPIAGFTAVSMWEIGSHINALIAASDLSLLSDDEFREKCKRLLQTVERTSRKRLVLPPETIDAMTGKGTTRFNSFDTGRLLIALYRLRTHRLAPAGLDKLVASWDFAQVIRNRRLHSYRSREFIEDFASNYAEYAATGARLWGLDVASPMDDFATLPTADEEMALLAQTVAFGVIGAEPSFLHLLEIPTSPTASFLGNCLDALLSRLAEVTGSPAAPSETPLDRSPWFSYQGFDLRRLDHPWTVQFEGRGEDMAAQEMAQSLRATSTKAAYLWHALRPSGHSARLVETMREKARKPHGFDSALFEQSGTTTDGYSDLNTNAVVLQSVAHILTSGR